MSVWNEPEDSRRFMLVWRDTLEQDPVRATAQAVLEEIGRQRQRGEEDDVVAALEAVADREQPEALTDRFEELKREFDDVVEERKKVIDQHNRALETVEEFETQGIHTAEHRERYEDAEAVVEEQSAQLEELNDRLDKLLEEIKRIGRRINREVMAVTVMPSSPTLQQPDDPRSVVWPAQST